MNALACSVVRHHCERHHREKDRSSSGDAENKKHTKEIGETAGVAVYSKNGATGQSQVCKVRYESPIFPFLLPYSLLLGWPG